MIHTCDIVFHIDMAELGVDFIDVVFLSVPPFIDPVNEFPKVLLMWQVSVFAVADCQSVIVTSRGIFIVPRMLCVTSCNILRTVSSSIY